MKVIFLGTPEFSLTVLKKLTASRHKVVAVVTQPDRPSGRGHKLEMPPVKILANSLGIDVLQPERISKEVEILSKYNADIMVTASFGQILKENVLNFCPHGVINVHPSLLPKYRGSSPIQWAIIMGEKITGVTIMKTELSLDSGDIILVREVKINDGETTGELSLRLAEIGGDMLVEALDLIEIGKASFTPQNHEKATIYPMFKPDSGKIDFNKTAKEIINLVRGVNPWPIAFVMLDEMTKLKVFKADKANIGAAIPAALNGSVIWADSKNGLGIKCSDGVIILTEIQAPGKNRMNSKDFLRGNKIDMNIIF